MLMLLERIRSPSGRNVRGERLQPARDRRALLLARREPWTVLVSSFVSHSRVSLEQYIINSVLVHPNTGDAVRDHTELATWMGTPFPVYTRMLRKNH